MEKKQTQTLMGATITVQLNGSVSVKIIGIYVMQFHIQIVNLKHNYVIMLVIFCATDNMVNMVMRCWLPKEVDQSRPLEIPTLKSCRKFFFSAMISSLEI